MMTMLGAVAQFERELPRMLANVRNNERRFSYA